VQEQNVTLQKVNIINQAVWSNTID
jgi:hypothetical protein